MTEAEFIEFQKCAQSFEYFCENYVFVEDKETNQPIKFKLWDCQKYVFGLLVQRKWIWAVKARRLGFTWLMVVFCVWKITFSENFIIGTLAQDKEFAKDFLDRMRYVQDRLPEYMQVKRVNARGRSSDNKTRIDFDHHHHGCLVRSLASSKKAARSMSGDIVIMDEAAYHEYLNQATQAVEPILERGKGICVVMSTSDGPHGDFYNGWLNANKPNSKYVPVFFGWNAHPGRTQEWYDKEKLTPQNLAKPLRMKQEYPATAEEAFEAATGRVYPMFSGDVSRPDSTGHKFIKTIPLHADWLKYRGMDWGGTDPFVCLWATVIPGDGPMLTIDPKCENTIREMLAYSWDENGQPLDEDNHTCDVLRYLVITPGTTGLTGHVHIYRELYFPDSAARGKSIVDLGTEVLQMTEETIELTVADRSRPDSILLMRDLGIEPITGQRTLKGVNKGEIKNGIQLVNILVSGTMKGKGAKGLIEKPAGQSLTAFRGGFLA